MLRAASARGTVSDSLRFAPAFARSETPFRMTAFIQTELGAGRAVVVRHALWQVFGDEGAAHGVRRGRKVDAWGERIPERRSGGGKLKLET